MARSWWRGLAALGVAGVGLIGICAIGCFGVPCVKYGVTYGMWPDRCPVGEPNLQLTAEASGVLRGGRATVTVTPAARFVARNDANAPIWTHDFARGVALVPTLVDADGAEVPGVVFSEFRKRGGRRVATMELPDLPDGDYTLKILGETGFDDATVEVPIALFRPAVAHLLTDRPLYRPGQTVLLRSLLLARTDLAPLDGRPGTWRIIDPTGAEMLVEKDKAGAFGVADADFPLDAGATVGTWRARYESGDASDEVTFDVRPFRLPRLSVDAKPSKSWYTLGDAVAVEGTATYASGAPVANAAVVVRLRPSSGRWPMPIAWEEAREATTDNEGKFRVDYGDVPVDLVERNAFSATVTVTEEAGEVVTGAASVVLSQDDLWVDAVTELGDGLVAGANNRAYLRVRRPDGSALPGASIVVTNPWDETEPPRTATTDEDGVAAVQLDAGDPVTVVDPAVPVRVRPLVADAPSLSSADDLSGHALGLDDRRAFDRLQPAIAACGDLAPGGASSQVALHVDASGRVREVRHGGALVDACVGDAVRGLVLPASGPRTLTLTWRVPDSLRPSLRPDTRSVFGGTEPVRAALERALIRARTCVPRDHGRDGGEVLRIHWSVDAEERAVRIVTAALPDHGLSPGEVACVTSRLSGVTLADDADQDDLGTAVVRLSVPRAASDTPPPPMTHTGFELKVTVAADGRQVGSGRLVLDAGSVPNLRLRATPSLPAPGEEVVVELFRGPGYSGDLPTSLSLYQGATHVATSPVDATSKSVSFRIPSDGRGFYQVDASGARALVFVRPADPLSVEVTSDAESYGPGQTATVRVRTLAGDRPIEAGVLLLGVDESLGQLAPLLGPDEYGRVTVRATSDRPAFDVFDARALSLGAIRGDNAAKAALLRVSTLPSDAAGDAAVYASGYTPPEEEDALLARFYRVYAALVPRVRAWEADAPAGEVMTPERLVRIWDEALGDVEAAGTPPVDGFGRRLSVAVLPDALLAQIDPRLVVQDGTRLPEDVVDFRTWVREEVSR